MKGRIRGAIAVFSALALTACGTSAGNIPDAAAEIQQDGQTMPGTEDTLGASDGGTVALTL